MIKQRMLIWTLAASCVAFGTAGCTAEQTEQGEAPDVDLDVDPGQWPEYEVDWAEVDVGTREQTVTTPVVRIEEETRQVSVPYIDINPPGARDRQERTIRVDVDVPHAGYTLEISEIRASGDNLWVIARLNETDQAAAQAMTRASDQVVVNAPADLDVRKIVVGQQPPGGGTEHRFVGSMDALNQMIPQESRVIYQRGGSPSTN